MWTSILGIGEKLLDIVGRFIPDKEKQLEAVKEINRVVQETVQAEMKSAWFIGQWRAMAMLALSGAIMFRYATGALNFGNDTDLTIGLIWLIGFGGYALTPDAIKTAMMLLKHKKEDSK